MYVIKINAAKNEIVVGPKSALVVKEIHLRNLNILADIENQNDNISVKIRSTGRMIKAHVKIKDGLANVHLREKECGISSGQACVFYSKNKNGDKVLGGGWITKVQ